MTENRFLARLNTGETLLFDGAMGTMLHDCGEDIQSCFDELNLSNPAMVADIHRAYIEAGAQVIKTNTFGANRFKLAEHGLGDQLEAINCAGISLAQEVVEATNPDVLIAGDVGPLGIRLAPFGRVQSEQAQAAFAEQIGYLANCHADLILIETISDLFEIVAAIKAAKSVTDLPVLASMSFTRDDRTLLGDTPEKVAQTLHEVGADVIGINCSSGPAQLLRLLKRMRTTLPDARFSVMPNAGWPERVGGRIMYSASPEYFGDYALAFRQAGACVVGGCCGTTPQHIMTMHNMLAQTLTEIDHDEIDLRLPRQAIVTPPSEKTSELAGKLAEGKFAICVEMDPPRGLSTHKLHAGASLLAEAGADVINVADSPMARMRMSPWAVCNLIQRDVGIETTLHFPTRGRNLLRVQGDLLAAHAIGVRNVFVVMGDPTEIGDYPEAMDDYDLSPTGLIKLIKQGFNLGVDHAGIEIGEPTNFFVGSALNPNPKDPERELRILRRKLESGADFFLTQPVYEPQQAGEFMKKVSDALGETMRPVMVGILPLYSARHARFLHNEVPGIVIPEETRQRIEDAGAGAPQEGVRIAIELIQQIKAWGQGIYLMPAFGRYELATEIIEVVKE
jgi:methionine synthase I (cobalamin-dependent)/5,10-methylenetetrahydrofolate reductase